LTGRENIYIMISGKRRSVSMASLIKDLIEKNRLASTKGKAGK